MGKLAGGSMVGFVGGGIAEGIVCRRECSDGGGVRKRRVVCREWLQMHEKGVAGEWRASCAQAEWHIREQSTASGYLVPRNLDVNKAVFYSSLAESSYYNPPQFLLIL